MNCPSCSFTNGDGVHYCGRCRMSFSKLSLSITRFRDHLYWIFRRANAGFLAGMVAWFFIPALSRVISAEATATLHFCIQGLLGGAFLGTVDGMVEESSPKMLRGALMGAVGGAIGGYIFGMYSESLTPEQIDWGIFGFWALTGACIGTVSAMWERQAKKLFVGSLMGLIGGGLGGALGYGVYAYLIEEFKPEGWVVRRLTEAFHGGIIGLTLWFFIGIAERFVIFKRRRIEGRAHKTCDHCSAKNPLNTWYCGQCGSVLQESAPPASLNLSAYQTLERKRDLFKFLSQLSIVTGFIAGVVVFVVFLPVHKLLAFVATVMVAVSSYSLQIFFASVSETIQIMIKSKS